MAVFRFRLDPLLEARRREEQEHRRAVAGIERERLDVERRIADRRDLVHSGKGAVRERLVGAVDIDSLRGHAARALHAVREVQRLALELAGVHRRLERARAELAASAARRRALESLRERRRAEWRRDLERREDARLDELAVIRASRSEEWSRPPVAADEG